jgi:hypothetical protein
MRKANSVVSRNDLCIFDTTIICHNSYPSVPFCLTYGASLKCSAYNWIIRLYVVSIEHLSTCKFVNVFIYST